MLEIKVPRLIGSELSLLGGSVRSNIKTAPDRPENGQESVSDVAVSGAGLGDSSLQANNCVRAIA